MSSRWRATVVAGLVAGVVVAIAGVAIASHQYWAVDDECSATDDPAGPYFYIAPDYTDWFVHRGEGFQGYCHIWTNPSSTVQNRAFWYLPISTSYNGGYNVRIWNDCDTHFRNTDVRYQRWAYGTTGGVTETWRFNQGGSPCDSIHHVGQGYFQGSSGGYVRLIDRSGDTTRPIGVDHLRYVPVPH